MRTFGSRIVPVVQRKSIQIATTGCGPGGSCTTPFRSLNPRVRRGYSKRLHEQSRRTTSFICFTYIVLEQSVRPTKDLTGSLRDMKPIPGTL
eukprot:scaffold137_cov111-Amphora_coffeaeformis.AAC.2